MEQKKINIFFHCLDRKQPKGQIAVFFILLLVAIFIFTVITINISQVSQLKTTTSIACDSTALSLASALGSMARARWRQIMAHMKMKGDSIDEEPDEYKICKWDWGRFWRAVGYAFIAWAIPYVGPIIAAISGAVDNVMFVKALKATERALNKLTPKAQMMEGMVSYALRQTVDDPHKEPDTHDLDEDGDLEELVSTFEVKNLERIIQVSQQMNIVSQLVGWIRTFFGASDSFRQSWGGYQQYPELIYHEDWIDALRMIDSSKLDRGSPPPPNNIYYPEDGEDMRLLADFEAVKLPRAGGGAKAPMSIGNVNIANLTSLQLDSASAGLVNQRLPDYPEELKYDFPFWQIDIQLPGTEINPIDYPTRVCDLGGMGEEGRPLPYGFDEVDYMVNTTAQFRTWAYGIYDYDYDATTDPNYVDPNQLRLKFNKALTELGAQEWKDRLRDWYPQLYNIDHPDQASLTNATWYVLIKDLAYKVGGPPTSATLQCGWYKELLKVLTNKRFFNFTSSNVAGNSNYNGLGVINPSTLTLSRTLYCGGKRAELRDKMQAICNKIMDWVRIFNGRLCPRVNWSYPCPEGTASGFVAATQPFNIDCTLCYRTGCGAGMNYCRACTVCMPALIANITAKRREVQTAYDTLNTEVNNCFNCSTRLYQICLDSCNDTYDDCVDDCSDSCADSCANATNVTNCTSSCTSSCEGDCDDDRTQCYTQCGIDAGARDTYCSNAFSAGINCRLRELNNVDSIMALAQKMNTLANSLYFVERDLITRTETAQNNIENFWFQGKQLLTNIERSVEAFRYLDDIDCRPAAQKYGGEVPSWFPPISNRLAQFMQTLDWNALWYVRIIGPLTGSWRTITSPMCDRVVSYSWKTKDSTGKEINHHVRVTIFDFPIPEIKMYSCDWGFGEGARLVNYDAEVAVAIERFDEDKAISLGGKNTWLDWVFRQRPFIANEAGCRPLDESMAANPTEALRCYGIRSYAIARYYPEIDSQRYSGKGIKLIETK